jgi:hypothetical protein
MEQNKLKLKDYCLTIEQAKELQALGVNMSDSMMVHFTLIDGTKIICERYELSGDKDYIDTLTNTEMLEMLPKEIDNCQLKIVPFNEGYCVEYELYMEHSVYVTKDGNTLDFCFPILKDALFEMIKCLKTNKLM